VFFVFVFKNKIWETLRADSLFSKSLNDLNVAEKKDLTGRR
jgi:hypothetical protein